jgi:hypothetical protein
MYDYSFTFELSAKAALGLLDVPESDTFPLIALHNRLEQILANDKLRTIYNVENSSQ